MPNDFSKIIAQASERAAKMDTIDRENGFATPLESGLCSCLRTAIEAIAGGIRNSDWDIVADGLLLIQAAEAKERGGEPYPIERG